MNKKKLGDSGRQGTAEQESPLPETEPGNRPRGEPGNRPEAEPGNKMLPPDAENPPKRREGIVSDPDR